jgi:hypothetical protein
MIYYDFPLPGPSLDALPMNFIITTGLIDRIPHVHSGKLNDLRTGFPPDLLSLAAFVDTWHCQKLPVVESHCWLADELILQSGPTDLQAL